MRNLCSAVCLAPYTVKQVTVTQEVDSPEVSLDFIIDILARVCSELSFRSVFANGILLCCSSIVLVLLIEILRLQCLVTPRSYCAVEIFLLTYTTCFPLHRTDVLRLL